jgi:SET domain-containing protein
MNLQLFQTVDRGWGVRTRITIPANTYVCEYVGEVIDEEVHIHIYLSTLQ